jgi:hypothetical protein
MIGAVRPARARTNACQPSPRTRSTLHGKYIWFKPQCAEPVYLRRRAASEDWTRNLGSPPPPGPPVPEGSPAPLPGSAETLAPPVPTETAPPPGGQNEGPAVAPSAFNTNGVAPTLSVSIAQYDPRTGRYAAPDGQVYQQTDLVTGTPNSWQDVILGRTRMFRRSMLCVVRRASAIVAVAVAASIATAGPARATACGAPLNGTYTAISDGQRAWTRDSYHDEATATATATWMVTSTCSSFLDCSGQVTSDQGWSGSGI